MVQKIAVRDAYGKALEKLGEIDEKVVVLEADVGSSTKSILFGKKYPERYFNVGISELNMVNMAAGFATANLTPFVNTFSVFMATRGGDPIQSLIAYDKLNVKLCGTYVGLSDSYDGASHHSITDIAYLRSIPNLTVITASDAIMAEKAVFEIAKYEGPVYLRLSRAAVPVVYDENLKFEIGKGIVLSEGDDLTIISTGTILSNVLKAKEELEKQGINVSVIDLHTIKPLDKDLVLKYAKKTKAILTIEEHSLQGGLFSAVSEVVAENYPVLVKGIGAEDFAESGDYEELLEKYGYGVNSIVKLAKELVEKK